MNNTQLLDDYIELQTKISQRKYSKNNCIEELLQLLNELQECYHNDKLKHDELVKRIESVKLKYRALKDLI